MNPGTRRTKALALGFTLALAVTAGCGQKAGVNQMYAGGAAVGAEAGAIPGSGADGLGGATDAGQLGADGSGSLGGGSGSLGGGSGSGSLGGGSGSGGTAGTGSGSGSTDGGTTPDGTTPDGTTPDGTTPGAGDRTGVTDTVIKIGVHAPVTGAAAIPQASFERAIGVYFDAVNDAGGINGRKVDVHFEDDGFDPNKARSKCKELAEQEKVFLLIGGAGADQIDACARYAAAAGVPYLSGGVHETRPGLGNLGDLSTYFAVSLTYEQQVPLLAKLVRSQFNGKKVAVIVADNDSLDNFYAKADAAIKQVAGGNLTLSRRIPKNTSSDAPAVGTAICQSGASAVVWNASPSSLLNVAKSMPCRVTFVGPGLTNGLNIVAQVGCPNVDGALFYSPFPGMDVMRRDAAFVKAYRAKNDAEPDDIGASIYGLEKLVGAMLQAAGKDLTRQSFLSAVARVKRFDTGVFPPTSFTSRFGGTAMNLLQANCGRSEYVTVRRNERP